MHARCLPRPALPCPAQDVDNSLHSTHRPCRDAGGVCPITSGEQTIRQLDLDQLSIGADAGILCAYILTCRLVAFLGIRFIKW